MAITFLQQYDRKVHTASSGIEIQRKFYFEPYSAFPDVLEALQGKVVADDNGVWKRTLPAKDSYLKNCFCNEVRVGFADSDAMASAIDLRGAADPPPRRYSQVLDLLQTEQESTVTGAAGGVVTASYRPLITALIDPDHENAFDWMDPQFNVTLREVPWPDGLFIATGGAIVTNRPVPKELGSPIYVPVVEFTIRRLLVGEPPWGGIAAAAGKINRDDFPVKNLDPPTNLPTMTRGTLRFEGADVTRRFSANGETWHELTYTFSWLKYADNPVFNEKGEKLGGLQPVTWNHVLMRPSFFGFGVNEMGWYFVGKQAAVELFDMPNPFFRASAGSLYTYGNFSHLFVL